jgi:hypothetical protein
LHGERRIRSHRGFGEQQEAQMRVNRPVKKMIALVLGGVAVAVAAVAGAQAAGAQPGARVVTVAAGDQGKSRAVPPMLGPLSPSELAEVRQGEAQQWQALSYRLPSGTRYSMAEMNVFAAEGYARS